MDESNWTYESKYTILKASPAQRERFRAATMEEVEEMAAFAWHIRAKKVCAKADLLIEEGVPDEEVRNILRVEPE